MAPGLVLAASAFKPPAGPLEHIRRLDEERYAQLESLSRRRLMLLLKVDEAAPVGGDSEAGALRLSDATLAAAGERRSTAGVHPLA